MLVAIVGDKQVLAADEHSDEMRKVEREKRAWWVKESRMRKEEKTRDWKIKRKKMLLE